MNKYLLILFIVLEIHAIEYTDSKNGLTHPFFGYRKPIIKEDDNKTKKTVNIPKNINKLTADELNKLIKSSKKIAVAFPTQNNIKNYIKLQNIATVKAEVFTTKWQQTILEDSSLDLSATASKSTFARNANTAKKEQQRAKFWEENIDKIGLVVFLEKGADSINQAQNKVMYFLSKDYPKLVIKMIYKEERRALAKKYKVGVTPDTFIVYKDKQNKANWYRVKAGLTTKNQILDNIDFVYKYFIEPGINK